MLQALVAVVALVVYTLSVRNPSMAQEAFIDRNACHLHF